ncbi:MAG: methionine--tRNA ligase [Candidatus Pacebacteria bacterium]|nr:methionine--tRNA ligase [Candidatus Paceibacterota bacterium]
MANKNFYITTTLPYVNASPHIGFALEITEADVLARYHRLIGQKVIFNTGTDEHGQKIYQKAQAAQLKPQQYCDQYAAKFADLKKLLNLSYDHFIRTTDDHHVQAAQEFWQRCQQNQDIYQKLYQVKYCVGCELEKTDSELKHGRCPLHPNQELEVREEENYFFRFSKYQQPLLELYQQQPEFVQPAGKMAEIVSFVQQGLQDFSISRLKTKMPWGIAVPGDPQHVMYVWFDALINYISTLGWPQQTQQFAKFWPGVQVAGKDNLRQQAAMWQAMLMSAGLANSQKILINGFISVAGQKMSKSLGNVIAPQELVDRYGIDASRFLLINLGTFNEDMDVTWKRLDTEYTAHLANGLGNLCSRVAKLAAQSQVPGQQPPSKFNPAYQKLFNNYQLTAALNWCWQQVQQADQYLSEQKPWQLQGQAQQQVLQQAIKQICQIGYHLQPFMPKTAAQLLNYFTQTQLKALKPLFPRVG